MILKGGTDSMDNLVTACWECNQGKKDMVIKEIR
ncbi:HNH endonuclease [Brevibacillus thermoruber]